MYADRDGMTLVAVENKRDGIVLQTAEGLKRLSVGDWLLYPPGAQKPLAMKAENFHAHFIPLED